MTAFAVVMKISYQYRKQYNKKVIAFAHRHGNCTDSRKEEKIVLFVMVLFVNIMPIMPPRSQKIVDNNFSLKVENDNKCDKFAVAIMMYEETIWYIPRNPIKIFNRFLSCANCMIKR